MLDDKGFWTEKPAILDAIRELFTLAHCRFPLPVRDYGRYRDKNWRDQNNDLVPYHSVDWYVFDALNEESMQVDAERILDSLCREPWRAEKMIGDHYDLFFMEEDMFERRGLDAPQAPVDYRVGSSRRLMGAVISTHRLEHIWGMPYSYLKTEVMRQLCFMFGLPETGRDDVLHAGDDTYYCKNTCILRPAFVAPDDWERLTLDRLRAGPLCESCISDLKAFFAAAAEEAE